MNGADNARPHRGEIKALTSLRGIAAILVALQHFGNQFGPNLALRQISPIIDQAWLWVAFFFILSGFVMEYVYGERFRRGVRGAGYLDFLIRRLGRVWPLHVTLLMLFILTEFAKYAVASSADPAFSHNTVPAILSNLALVQAWHIHRNLTWDEPVCHEHSLMEG